MNKAGSNAAVVVGVLDNYAPDPNDPEDECFGLYLKIGLHSVFVDIREDKDLEQRKLKALQLFNSSITLQASLEAFVQANPEFETRSVSYIGLHSANLDQGEVFWEPTGYTRLKGLSFVLE